MIVKRYVCKIKKNSELAVPANFTAQKNLKHQLIITVAWDE